MSLNKLVRSKKLMCVSVALMLCRTGSVLLKRRLDGHETKSSSYYSRAYVSHSTNDTGRLRIGIVKEDGHQSLHDISYTSFADKKYNGIATRETKPTLQYHHVSLLNEDVLRTLHSPKFVNYVQENDGPKALGQSVMEKVFELYSNAMDKKGSSQYACSIEATVIEGHAVYYGGEHWDFEMQYGDFKPASYRMNLVMASPSEGLKISSVELKSYWPTAKVIRDPELDIFAVKKVESVNGARVPKEMLTNRTKEGLAEACKTFSSRSIRRDVEIMLNTTVWFVGEEVINFLEYGWKTSVKLHVHLPNEHYTKMGEYEYD